MERFYLLFLFSISNKSSISGWSDSLWVGRGAVLTLLQSSISPLESTKSPTLLPEKIKETFIPLFFFLSFVIGFQQNKAGWISSFVFPGHPSLVLKHVFLLQPEFLCCQSSTLLRSLMSCPPSLAAPWRTCWQKSLLCCLCQYANVPLLKQCCEKQAGKKKPWSENTEWED